MLYLLSPLCLQLRWRNWLRLLGFLYIDCEHVTLLAFSQIEGHQPFVILSHLVANCWWSHLVFLSASASGVPCRFIHKLEHPTRVDKIVPSLLCWDVLMSPVLLLINDIQNTYYTHSSWSILNETYPTLAASNSAKDSESSGMDELTLVPRWSSYLHISIGIHRLTCAVQVGSQYDTRAYIALHCLHIDTCRNATQGWTRILSLTTSVLHSYIWSWKAHNFINIFVFYNFDAT